MASQLPSQTLKRARIQSPTCPSQRRNASLLRRPHRPYTFTQLVTLSDGSSFLTRTTSPAPIYKSTKDTRNHPLWQPSLSSLRNVEQDEAGRLRAFRAKFGRGWDLDSQSEAQEGIDGKGEEGGDSLLDLIAGTNENVKLDAGKKKKIEVVLETPAPKRMITVKDENGKMKKVPAPEEGENQTKTR